MATSCAVRRAAVILGALALLAAGSPPPPARAAPFPVTVGAPFGRPVASGFLGLALEYRSIPQWIGAGPSGADPVLVQLIRNLVPGGRPVLRIGGQSTDRTWWPVPGLRRPIGITYDLTPQWIADARALAQATDARLLLGVGLEADQPRIDAVEATQLLRGLGGRYVDALELGNEPELYTLVPWYRRLNGVAVPWYSQTGTPVLARGPGYDPAAFYGEFARTLAVLPRAPIAAPDTGLVPWLDGIRPFLSAGSRVRIVTWHAYALSQCVTDATSPDYPTVPNLLLPAASHNLVSGIAPIVSLAHAVGAGFRIDEMNSVTCNGRAGVSNTFASALWLMDGLFSIAAAGVDGVNIHTYPGAANGLFDLARAGGTWDAVVHPLYYGALMFAQAAPPGSRLLAIQSPPQAAIRAWATIAPDHRIRVLLINDSLTAAARVSVRVPAGRGAASVERLVGRSAYATSDISLGGATFAPQTPTGLLAAPRTAVIAQRAGAYAITLPATSAALVTMSSISLPA